MRDTTWNLEEVLKLQVLRSGVIQTGKEGPEGDTTWNLEEVLKLQVLRSVVISNDTYILYGKTNNLEYEIKNTKNIEDINII